MRIYSEDQEGKQKQNSKYFKTRAEAAAWLAEAIHKLNTGTFIEPTKIKFGEWLNRWLTIYVRPNVKISSYSNYEQIARTHIIPALGDIPLQSLRTTTIQEFYVSKGEKGRLDGKGGLSPRIINLLHQVINGSLKQAIRENLISVNPAEYTTRPSLKQKEMTPLTPEQVNQYLKAAKSERLYTAFLVELTSGLRRGELLALTWDCINLVEHTMTIKKTLARVRLQDKGKSELQFSEPKTESSKRDIPLLPQVIQQLKTHRIQQTEEKLFHGKSYHDNNLIFATENGKPIEPRNFFRLHTKILKNAGLPHVRFHDLRHTVATILLQQGENPENLRDLLGHTKTSTTLDLYCHSTLEGKKQAVSRLAKIIKA